jgi:hypothetical protein
MQLPRCKKSSTASEDPKRASPNNATVLPSLLKFLSAKELPRFTMSKTASEAPNFATEKKRERRAQPSASAERQSTSKMNQIEH